MFYRLAFILVVTFVQGVAAPREDGERVISAEQASALVYKAIEGTEQRQLSGFNLENGVPMPNFPHFYWFEAIWNNPEPGSGVAGHWAVDRRTGDVWDPFSCMLVTSPALKIELDKLRKEKKISSQAVQRARREKPCL